VLFVNQLILLSRNRGQKCRIPNVVGAVDGTQIPIIALKADEAFYVCRKGYHHRINVQAVADTNLWFVNTIVHYIN